MSCPLNRNRWAGSGYVKPTVASSELDSKIQQMIAERERQDATLYPQIPVMNTPTPTPIPTPKNNVQTKR